MQIPTRRYGTFNTNVNINWSDGSPFNGYVAIAIVLPTFDGTGSWPKATLGNVSPAQELPQSFAMVPIQSGKLPAQLGLFYNADINPPNTQYVAYFYDSALVGIAGPTAFFTVNSATVNLPSFILPVPITTGALTPVPDIGCHGQGTGANQLNPQAWSINETPGTTGAPAVITLLFAPLPGKLSLFFNGSMLTEGSHYTVSGNIITMLVPFIPQPGDNIRATYPYSLEPAIPNTPPFSIGDRVVINEIPAGAMDGSNVTFTLTNIPNTGTLSLFFNGSYLTQNFQYTLTDNIITLTAYIPVPGDLLRADYIWHA